MKKSITPEIAITAFALCLTLSVGCAVATPFISTTLTTADSQNSTPLVLQTKVPLSITRPEDGADIDGNTVEVTGQTAPSATVTIGDQATNADSDGNFTLTINLSNGPNAIDVIATDTNGQVGEVLLIVNATNG